MGGTGDARVEGSHHPANCTLELQADPFRVNIAAGGYFQGMLNGTNIMDGGNDELGRGNQPALDLIVMDERTARRFNQAITFTIARSVGDQGFTLVKRLGKNLSRTFNGVHELDAAAKVVKQDGVSGVPKRLLKMGQVLIRARGTHAVGHIDAGQAVCPQNFPTIIRFTGITIF